MHVRAYPFFLTIFSKGRKADKRGQICAEQDRRQCASFPLLSLSKADEERELVSIEELDLLYRIPNSVPISARMWLNIDELIEVMWEKLDMIRVYTRPRGKLPDYSSPVVLPKSKASIEGFCDSIHVSVRLHAIERKRKS